MFRVPCRVRSHGAALTFTFCCPGIPAPSRASRARALRLDWAHCWASKMSRLFQVSCPTPKFRYGWSTLHRFIAEMVGYIRITKDTTGPTTHCVSLFLLT